LIKILSIGPVVYTDALKKATKEREKLSESIERELGGVVQVDFVNIEKGATSIESAFDEAINVPYILEKVKWAEKEGYNAVVVDCFGDPGLDAAREIANIPIIGPNHSACHLAAQVGGRFSVITILPQAKPLIRDLIKKYGLIENLASIRTIDIPVLDLEDKPKQTVEKTIEIAREAITEDEANAIVFGCTGMAWLLEEVQKQLKEEHNLDVPIIEPFRVAIYNAIMWVLYGTSHSKIRYQAPRPKERVGLEIKL